MKKIISNIILIYSLSLNVLAADYQSGRDKSKVCSACHGVDGNSLQVAFPKIAGQNETYILKQLKDFKSQKRKDPTMFGMVTPLSDKDMADLAHYYANNEVAVNTEKYDKDLIVLGEKLYRAGNKDRNITACQACHGPKGQGIPSAKFPAVKFQYIAYTEKQLINFRQAAFNKQQNTSGNNARENDIAGIMRDVAKSLTNKEIKAVAQYIAKLH